MSDDSLVNRRRYLIGSALLMLGLTAPAALSQPADEVVSVTFEWLVAEFDVAAVRESLPSAVVERPVTAPAEDKGAAVFVFAGVVLLPVLAESLIKARKNVAGGIYIERRPDGSALMRREEGLNTGEILYVDDRGIQVYRTTSDSQLAAILTALRGLFRKK